MDGASGALDEGLQEDAAVTVADEEEDVASVLGQAQTSHQGVVLEVAEEVSEGDEDEDIRKESLQAYGVRSRGC